MWLKFLGIHPFLDRLLPPLPCLKKKKDGRLNSPLGKSQQIHFAMHTLGVVVEVVEGRAGELGQLAGLGGVDAGPAVEVLGTVGGTCQRIGLETSKRRI